LILEDGSEYMGYGFGANEERVLEIVFNTSMVGYQEIVCIFRILPRRRKECSFLWIKIFPNLFYIFRLFQTPRNRPFSKAEKIFRGDLRTRKYTEDAC